MKQVFVFLFFMVNFIALNAQSPLQIDSSQVVYRDFDAEEIEKFSSQRAYNYENDPKYEQNPIKKLWLRFLRNLRGRIGETGLNAIWEVVKYSLILVGLFILIRFLFSSSKTRMFKKDDKSPEFHGDLIKSEGGGENIAMLISDAESSGNFKLAVSYLFLDVLRSLDRKGIIDWRVHKTNIDYENEIENISLKRKFKNVSREFEYIVYGEFEIDNEKYKIIKSDFSNIESIDKEVGA